MEGQAAEIREAIDAIHLGCSGTVSLIPHDAIINELESLTLVDHRELVCRLPELDVQCLYHLGWTETRSHHPEQVNGGAMATVQPLMGQWWKECHMVVLGDTK